MSVSGTLSHQTRGPVFYMKNVSLFMTVDIDKIKESDVFDKTSTRCCKTSLKSFSGREKGS